MSTEMKNVWALIAVVVLAVILISVWYSKRSGSLNYQPTYAPRQFDARNAQAVAARRAAAEAAKFANPFKVDPFAKVKDVLNPFK